MLFDKAIAFTDIHFGHKANSTEHNEDCVQFIKWMIELAKEKNIETCLFLGDWHHNRQTVNVETLNYSYQGMKLLNDNFKETYFIVGNHDLYFRLSWFELKGLRFLIEFNINRISLHLR